MHTIAQMKDLSNVWNQISTDKQRDKIFKQGVCFMNLEVIYPTSVNVIPYGPVVTCVPWYDGI